MKATYWIRTPQGWSKGKTLDEALDRAEGHWQVFVQYGRSKPQLVRWGVAA